MYSVAYYLKHTLWYLSQRGAKRGETCPHMPARCANCSGNHAATASHCPRQKKRVERPRETTAAPQTVTEKNTSRSLGFAVVIDNRGRNRHQSMLPAQTLKRAQDQPQEQYLDQS
jgi:hypothetical protein